MQILVDVNCAASRVVAGLVDALRLQRLHLL
jgi:hypothetical protein